MLPLQVDVAGFEAEMQQQRQRSKDSAKVVDLEVGGALATLAGTLAPTQFRGYSELDAPATVLALLRHGEPVSAASAGLCFATSGLFGQI